MIFTKDEYRVLTMIVRFPDEVRVFSKIGEDDLNIVFQLERREMVAVSCTRESCGTIRYCVTRTIKGIRTELDYVKDILNTKGLLS